ncbi:potassium transporter KefB [Mucilaginibacter pallidiroseus]|uniref:Potassium transporter KefB n=1 Tax=Mucilaginibacter pallidiroseus TaxID=2599295 RepID=A0A563UJE8_9SPHI|nr:potassium transporter KefB [Mucilaginibacter pallidiroseus]TWR31492.1 potassium transporter KefB [Mucilaginibacter pallidiroseus]
MAAIDTAQRNQSGPLGKRILQGAGVGLIIVSTFLLQTGEPDPTWNKYWVLRPLLVMTFAGAMSGVFYYLMGNMRSKGGWHTVLANVLSFVVFAIGMWMGMVLGFAGTYWH